MTAKTGKYDRDKLFQTKSRDKDPTNIHFMYFSHHNVEATQVLSVLPYIISEDLLVNPNNFITRSGI